MVDSKIILFLIYFFVPFALVPFLSIIKIHFIWLFKYASFDTSEEKTKKFKLIEHWSYLTYHLNYMTCTNGAYIAKKIAERTANFQWSHSQIAFNNYSVLTLWNWMRVLKRRHDHNSFYSLPTVFYYQR